MLTADHHDTDATTTISPDPRLWIPPLPGDYLDRVRRLGTDDLGQPVKRLIAEGGEPCRDVLRRALPGEELILASFTPFKLTGPYKEYGPIFLLAADRGELVRREILPIDEAQTYLREQFVIRAYSRNEEIVDAVMATPRSAAEVVHGFFASQQVAFLHVRFPTYGCFACRIDRR